MINSSTVGEFKNSEGAMTILKGAVKVEKTNGEEIEGYCNGINYRGFIYLTQEYRSSAKIGVADIKSMSLVAPKKYETKKSTGSFNRQAYNALQNEGCDDGYNY